MFITQELFFTDFSLFFVQIYHTYFLMYRTVFGDCRIVYPHLEETRLQELRSIILRTLMRSNIGFAEDVLQPMLHFYEVDPEFNSKIKAEFIQYLSTRDEKLGYCGFFIQELTIITPLPHPSCFTLHTEYSANPYIWLY